MKKGNEINLGLSDSTSATDFRYSMSGKVISITYLGATSIYEEDWANAAEDEHWH
jgi:hypothetical protein